MTEPHTRDLFVSQQVSMIMSHVVLMSAELYSGKMRQAGIVKYFLVKGKYFLVLFDKNKTMNMNRSFVCACLKWRDAGVLEDLIRLGMYVESLADVRKGAITKWDIYNLRGWPLELVKVWWCRFRWRTRRKGGGRNSVSRRGRWSTTSGL